MSVATASEAPEPERPRDDARGVEPIDRPPDGGGVWLGFTAAQLRALCEDYVALDGATIVQCGQTPTLDVFIGRCAQEYRALTGIELMRLPRKPTRRRERRKGGL